EPVVDTGLSRFVTEGRHVLLNQEIAAVEPMKRLGAFHGNAQAQNTLQRLILCLPAPEQRLEPLQFPVRWRYAECSSFCVVHGCLLVRRGMTAAAVIGVSGRPVLTGPRDSPIGLFRR